MPNTTSRARSNVLNGFTNRIGLRGGLFAVGFALAWSTPAVAEPATAKTPADSPQNVESTFADAVELFKNGDSTHALPLFVQLGEVTNSPNVQLYVGYCHLELGHDREAHQAFSLSLKQSTELGDARYAATREAAQTELAKLKPRLASLTISLVKVPNEFVVKLDDEVVDPAQLGSPVVVSPGLHHIEAEASGSRSVSREVSVDKGDTKMVAILFEERTEKKIDLSSPEKQIVPAPMEPASSRLTVLGFVTGGLGVAGLGTYALAGLRARSAYNQLQADCPTRCSDAAHRNDASSGKTFQTLANVGLAVGIVGTLAGTTLLYLGWAHGDAPKTSVDLSVGSVKLSYRGSF
jgi:hypothetical protein